MKYCIYGANRVAKDFLYIFDHLEVLCFIDDEFDGEEFLGTPVKRLADALQAAEHGQIILCGFDKRAKEERLMANGLSYGTDYIYEEDFFPSLDDFHIPQGRALAVWGTGHAAARFAQWNRAHEIAFYLDNYKSREFFHGAPVKKPSQIADWHSCFVVIAVDKDADIVMQLQELGLKANEDFASYQKVMGAPSEMLRKTIFDPAQYDLTCDTMLNHLEILSGGSTRCCCTTFISQNLDSVLEKSMEPLWHSNLHKIMCLSTENKTFSFCDKTMCPLFVAQKSAPANVQPEPYKQMADAPKVLALGYDSSCNLACSTCRDKVYFECGPRLENVERITRKVEEEYLPQCEFLILAGDGEVFASPNYRKIYESDRCRPDYIRLLSNGTLFTPENWEKFKAGKSAKIMLTVSVDAATKDTYEQIRRNGSFDVLKRNMEFAAALRRRGELCYFRMNFVVQRENYREMIPFVQWGEALGVDEVFFTKILNWGTYTDEEFEHISMMEADGITPKPELREVLDHPAMKSKIADLGTIRYSHKADEAGHVENYYKWELEKRGGRLFI